MGSEKKVALCWMVVMSVMMMTSMATLQEDEQECAEQLTSLAGCIPYVSGSAKKPTAECCHDTQKLKESKPKCLCVLIKESTDTSMGLPINTTLALRMPSVCNIDAKVSNCPSLLNLPPNSPDAKIFTDAAGTDSTTPSTSTTTTTSTSDSPSTSSSTGSSSSSSPTTDSASKSSDSKTTSSTNDGSNTNFLGAGLVVMAFSAFLFI